MGSDLQTFQSATCKFLHATIDLYRILSNSILRKVFQFILMKIVAFDAKRFQRIKRHWDEGKMQESQTTIFVSQLGIGVTIPEPETFVPRYVDVNQELKQKFDLDYDTPFFSSTCLKTNLSIFDVADFASQLISKMQNHIEAVHCSYVVLPTTDTSYVEVGGVRCVKTRVPTLKFIGSLGPAFSYLTALSYIWKHDDVDLSNLEIHIDGFKSKHTKGWNVVKNKVTPKIFYKGDECNPFIACADIIAFLVDDMLNSKRLNLCKDNVKKVLQHYQFDTTVNFFDSHSQYHCAWQADQTINISNRLARPVVFLAMDSLTARNSSQEHDAQINHDTRAMSKPRKADVALRQTETYQAALKYAYQKNGCMKFFSANEDKSIIKSGDVFIHVGPESEKTGQILKEMVDIQTLSGLKVINILKNSKHGTD